MPANVGDIASQSQQILDLIQQQGNFYNTDPQSQNFQNFFQSQPFLDHRQRLEAGATGQDVPFTQDVVNSQLADNSDGIAGQLAQQQQLNRQQASRSGLGGSGFMQQRDAALRSQAGMQQRQGRRQIRRDETLGNFRARREAEGMISQTNNFQFQGERGIARDRFGAAQQATNAEVGFRQRLQDISSQQNQQNQWNQQQGTYQHRLNVLAGQANQPLQPGRGGYRDPGGTDQWLANRNTASTQFNALLASGPDGFAGGPYNPGSAGSYNVARPGALPTARTQS